MNLWCSNATSKQQKSYPFVNHKYEFRKIFHLLLGYTQSVCPRNNCSIHWQWYYLKICWHFLSSISVSNIAELTRNLLEIDIIFFCMNEEGATGDKNWCKPNKYDKFVGKLTAVSFEDLWSSKIEYSNLTWIFEIIK